MYAGLGEHRGRHGGGDDGGGGGDDGDDGDSSGGAVRRAQRQPLERRARRARLLSNAYLLTKVGSLPQILGILVS